MTADLAEWLLEQLAEDERIARTLPDNPGLWVRFGGESPREEHMLNWSPPRVLAECDAKRRMVELHRSVRRTCLGDEDNPAAWRDLCPTCGSGEPYEYPVFSPCDMLKLLALPYVDRSGYRPEWTL